MKRYIHSFILSCFIYSSLFGSLLYFLEDIDFSKNTKEIQKDTRMKVSLSSPQVKKIVKKTPQKIVDKIIPKPKPKPKPKKSVKKRAFIQKTVEPLKIEPEIKDVQTPKQEPILTQVSPTKSVVVDKNKILKEQEEAQKLARKQNLFLSQLRDAINKNKTYPNTARRRNIQGEIKVRFQILPSGHVDNIQIVAGKNIFKKSIFSAIKNSFPIKIDKSLFSFPKEFSVSINYVLK